MPIGAVVGVKLTDLVLLDIRAGSITIQKVSSTTASLR
jgi:hypothetical protein